MLALKVREDTTIRGHVFGESVQFGPLYTYVGVNSGSTGRRNDFKNLIPPGSRFPDRQNRITLPVGISQRFAFESVDGPPSWWVGCAGVGPAQIICLFPRLGTQEPKDPPKVFAIKPSEHDRVADLFPPTDQEIRGSPIMATSDHDPPPSIGTKQVIGPSPPPAHILGEQAHMTSAGSAGWHLLLPDNTRVSLQVSGNNWALYTDEGRSRLSNARLDELKKIERDRLTTNFDPFVFCYDPLGNIFGLRQTIGLWAGDTSRYAGHPLSQTLFL